MIPDILVKEGDEIKVGQKILTFSDKTTADAKKSKEKDSPASKQKETTEQKPLTEKEVEDHK